MENPRNSCSGKSWGYYLLRLHYGQSVNFNKWHHCDNFNNILIHNIYVYLLFVILTLNANYLNSQFYNGSTWALAFKTHICKILVRIVYWAHANSLPFVIPAFRTIHTLSYKPDFHSRLSVFAKRILTDEVLCRPRCNFDQFNLSAMSITMRIQSHSQHNGCNK